MTFTFARIAGAFEHPDRDIPGKSLEQVYMEITAGVLADAGLSIGDVDGLLTAKPPGGLVGLAELLGLSHLRYVDSTDTGGASYISHVGHAARAIASGQCNVALVIMAGLPRQPGSPKMIVGPEAAYERSHGATLISMYAMAAQRHMYEYGTRAEDLAEVKVAAAQHASRNPHAMLRDPVTIEQVLDSPFIAAPLHRLDCCVTTDGGGAVLVVSEAIARSLPRPLPGIVSHAESIKYLHNDGRGLTSTGADLTGPVAFAEAGLTPRDIDYASVYDSFTITVLMALEDLGFCAKGEGGRFVREGGLLAPNGRLPLNTDGGGLCNNHPDMRGGMIRMIEAVRQTRGQAHPELQVPNCEFALVQGVGYSVASRAASATLILSGAGA